MTTDPIDLAREVVRRAGHLDRDALLHSEKERLDLALAVHDLVSKVKRVEALADWLDAEADRIGTSGGGATVRAFAAEIRTALSGDTND